MPLTSDLEAIDLTDTDLYSSGNHHEAFRLLRAHAPVHWTEKGPWPAFWSVTRHADIVAIGRDPERFVSSRGTMMHNDPAVPLGYFEQKMLNWMDPPRHTHLRRAFQRAFTPKAIAALETRVRAIAARVVDEVAGRGTCDFFTDVAVRFPLRVLCDFIGIPESDWARVEDWAVRLARPDAITAQMEVIGYFADLATERRKDPRADLMTALVEAQRTSNSAEPVTDEDVLLFCLLLLLAGDDTARDALSEGVLALIEHPEQAARLRRDPSRLPSAVEEILRWSSPIRQFGRVATTDVELHGQKIASGQKIVLWFVSANRDEAVFENPSHFDVARTPNEHLAFGTGNHTCIGTALARLELRIMIEEWSRRFASIVPRGPVVRRRSPSLSGVGAIVAMPIDVAAAL